MTETEAAAVVATPAAPRLSAKRAGGRDAARIIIFGQAALLFIIAILYVTARAFFVIDLLAFAGAVVLLWGGLRMGRDTDMPLPTRDDAVTSRRVPWDWTDFVIAIPAAFTASSVLVSLTIPLTDLFTNGLDPTVRTAVESFVEQASFYGGALFNIWVLVGLRRGGSFYHLGWRKFSWWWIPISVLAAAATLYISGVLQLVSEHLFPTAQNTQCQAVQHDYSHFLILAIIVVCFMAPLAEELIFRGFTYGWLRRVMPTGVAIVVSGAVFALAHGVLLLFIPLWAVGIILAVLFQSSRSLWPGAVTHALFNLPGIFAILSAPSC
ncbi:MAG: lysostaphin resistance A-like protein [Candidatus Dormibacteria bacterium]